MSTLGYSLLDNVNEDDNNKKLPSGLYLYSLQSGGFRHTKIMRFLK